MSRNTRLTLQGQDEQDEGWAGEGQVDDGRDARGGRCQSPELPQ